MPGSSFRNPGIGACIVDLLQREGDHGTTRDSSHILLSGFPCVRHRVRVHVRVQFYGPEFVPRLRIERVKPGIVGRDKQQTSRRDR